MTVGPDPNGDQVKVQCTSPGSNWPGPSVRLQDVWKICEDSFPDAVPCVDWDHVSEHLWDAGRTVYRKGTEELKQWVHARHKELRQGDIEAVLAAVEELRKHVGKSGPGTRGRRERITATIRFISNVTHQRSPEA